jgi:Paraquat-inducible protein A
MLFSGLGVLFCCEAFFGYQLHLLSGRQEQIKEDYSVINSITFGVFSVDQWRDKMVAVVNDQVQDFDITPEQKAAMQKTVELQLRKLVNKAMASINKPQKTIGGKLKKLVFNSMVNTDSVQAQIPSFAKTIVDKMSSPESKDRLKDIAMGKVNQLKNQTFDSTASATTAVTTFMYHKYHVSNNDELNKQLTMRLNTIRSESNMLTFAILGLILIVLGLWWLLRKQSHLLPALFVMSMLFAFVLIAVGISASIIEVDARLKTVELTLLGEKVSFQNQVLFFQSKSILGIVGQLIKRSKPDALLVGMLILIFIVIFPVIRMIAKGVYVLSTKKIAENKAVRYLAFEAGKWDMADVMVVGILMTYIGLNGILKSQLSNLNIHNSAFTAITENNSSLQPGYFIFVIYVLFALVLSYILKRITPFRSNQD